ESQKNMSELAKKKKKVFSNIFKFTKHQEKLQMKKKKGGGAEANSESRSLREERELEIKDERQTHKM
ncbi:hypothetical protein IscW_ISCW005756, partial [Ixodes scapularis]